YPAGSRARGGVIYTKLIMEGGGAPRQLKRLHFAPMAREIGPARRGPLRSGRAAPIINRDSERTCGSDPRGRVADMLKLLTCVQGHFWEAAPPGDNGEPAD